MGRGGHSSALTSFWLSLIVTMWVTTEKSPDLSEPCSLHQAWLVLPLGPVKGSKCEKKKMFKLPRELDLYGIWLKIRAGGVAVGACPGTTVDEGVGSWVTLPSAEGAWHCGIAPELSELCGGGTGARRGLYPSHSLFTRTPATTLQGPSQSAAIRACLWTPGLPRAGGGRTWVLEIS